jgi:hypothetical protein
MNTLNLKDNYLSTVSESIESLYRIANRLEKLRIQRDHNTQIMTDELYGINQGDYIDSSVDRINKIERLLNVVNKKLQQAVEKCC